MGYQARCIDGRPINLSKFNNETKCTVNYRCTDETLRNLLTDMRGIIDGSSKEPIISIADKITQITRADLSALYKSTDMVLCWRHDTIAQYNKLLNPSHEKYMITKSDEAYSRGEILYEKPKTKNHLHTNAFTTHSVQGESFGENIYIDKELLRDRNLFYTAISRAKRIEQLHIVV